ncbi:MAG: DUF6318 family protein, partial [Nocardioidaceae bacterium]
MAGALVAAGVSGCQSNPAPKALPSKAPASTAAASPVAAAPTMPAAARGTGPKAAKAFARHFFATINYAARTGEVEELRQLATDKCDSCRAIERNISKAYAAGGHIRSKGWKVTSLSLVPAQPEKQPILNVGLIQSPELVVPRRGAEPIRYPGGRKPMTMSLLYDAGEWQVTRLDVV